MTLKKTAFENIVGKAVKNAGNPHSFIFPFFLPFEKQVLTSESHLLLSANALKLDSLKVCHLVKG